MEFLYFIAGILFVSYFIPLLDGLSSLFLTWIEAKKGKLNEEINQSNIQIRKSAASAEEDPPRRLIGFCAEDSEECEEEDEDEI